MNTAILTGIIIFTAALLVFIIKKIANGTKRKNAEIKLLREEVRELKEAANKENL